MSLDVKEISRIIKLCRQSGVSRIKLGDLEMEFSSEVPMDSRERRVRDKPVERTEIERKTLEALEQHVKEEQITNLLIEDPEEYERRMAQGELDGGLEDARRAEQVIQ